MIAVMELNERSVAFLLQAERIWTCAYWCS